MLLLALLLLIGCAEEPEPTFEAEGCVDSQAPEVETAEVTGVLLPNEGEGRILDEVVVITEEWRVTYSGGSLTTDSEHCDCTSESFSFVTVESIADGKAVQAIPQGGTVCFRNTSTCGEIELLGAGVQGTPMLQLTGIGDLECEED
ncbi:MAG: hypothetical protein EXR71_00940 [Myxococcales bacterium]|nr:hypothetical protein [Myxococcales bacterium]